MNIELIQLNDSNQEFNSVHVTISDTNGLVCARGLEFICVCVRSKHMLTDLN